MSINPTNSFGQGSISPTSSSWEERLRRIARGVGGVPGSLGMVPDGRSILPTPKPSPPGLGMVPDAIGRGLATGGPGMVPDGRSILPTPKPSPPGLGMVPDGISILPTPKPSPPGLGVGGPAEGYIVPDAMGGGRPRGGPGMVPDAIGRGLATGGPGMVPDGIGSGLARGAIAPSVGSSSWEERLRRIARGVGGIPGSLGMVPDGRNIPVGNVGGTPVPYAIPYGGNEMVASWTGPRGGGTFGYSPSGGPWGTTPTGQPYTGGIPGGIPGTLPQPPPVPLNINTLLPRMQVMPEQSLYRSLMDLAMRMRSRTPLASPWAT